MKITKSKLKQIIKEELGTLMSEEQSQGEALVAAPLRDWVDTRQDFDIDQPNADRLVIQKFADDGSTIAVYNIGFGNRAGEIWEFSAEDEKGEKRPPLKTVEKVIKYIEQHAGL